ncbi:MAG: aminotransferase class I/II-fold pyridoxal phosphate-dependent enzyme [Ignavibacteriales bacterium]|nr:aminotransferase class I/II-fold pyridoxal phosphate-dependent enzyme [Ignavibacteriaceae bacterium]QOJ27898.1 MAG: aminotransferase class I/II-fold pyridoxal phosphate-dependent enzyme [Ignavibacteriales bacterium]
MDTKNKGFNTKLIHSGEIRDQFGSATVPIYQTSTFRFESAQHGADCFAGVSNGFIYSRIGNPTIRSFEQSIAELENGYDGIATSSGMGAITSVYMALLGAGSHLIGTSSVYGPARAVLEKDFSRFGVESDFCHTSDLDAIRKLIRPNTKVLYIETPANPTMEISDIAACAALAHEHGMILVVDNTFATPLYQRPLDLGADVVLHSVTKYINGHADIVGGIVVTRDKKTYDSIRHTMVYMGCNMDPHQAYLAIRGMKTLALRVERNQENAMRVAEFLENHPKVAWVRYPGLKSHPQYELAKKQMGGPGSMISFGVKGTEKSGGCGFVAGKTLMDSVKVAMLAVSLGGVETLIQHPASMTHAAVGQEDKLKAGITDDLVRLSVGIEDVEDIIDDLAQALEKV